MFKTRLSELSTGLALGCCLVTTSTSSGQIVVQGYALNRPIPSSGVLLPKPNSMSPQQHLGSGPIDMNNLPDDILNCDVCRQRLGLPPLRSSTSLLAPTTSLQTSQPSQTKTTMTLPAPKMGLVQPKLEAIQPQKPDLPPVPMLGSPGLISSGTASQMAALGYVVEEFHPPQPQPDAIQLKDIPPEVRQQFMKSLELPPGARVMSAEVLGKSNESIVTETSSETNPTVAGPDQSVSPLLSMPQLELLPTNERSTPIREDVLGIANVARVQERMEELAKKQAEFEQFVAEKNVALSKEREAVAKDRKKMDVQLEQMQSEWQKRMELADATNKEALSMLERRTAEVTALQMQLKALKEAIAKTESSEKPLSQDEPEKKKKTESKKDSGKNKAKENKKTEKTQIDT